MTLLLEIVSAQSPPLDPAMTAAPGESFYPDPEGILTSLCDICGISINYCLHKLSLEMLNPPVQQFFTAYDIREHDILDHPEWAQLQQDSRVNESHSLWVVESNGYNQHPLNTESVQLLDDNATTIQPSTVQEWVDGSYNAGDRRSPPATSHIHQRRNAPRQGGFPCLISDCGKVYDRHCDLTRHKKVHLDKSARPYKCSTCDEGFIYPKDRKRHQKTHIPQSLSCPVQGCNNKVGFSRKDNLRRHMRKQHPRIAMATR